MTGTLPDVGYVVNGVKFDGYDVGLRALQDAKGPGYATFTVSGIFREWYRGADSLVAQARRQIAAADGTPIRWEIAEPEALEAIENLFLESEIVGIDLVFTPPR